MTRPTMPVYLRAALFVLTLTLLESCSSVEPDESCAPGSMAAAQPGTDAPVVLDGLTIEPVPRPPTGQSVFASHAGQNTTGNTRIRYFPPRTGLPDKTDTIVPARYYFRDRDLGQTFTTGAQGFVLDAVTLRLGPTDTGPQPGARGAAVSLQILRVTGDAVVDDNGTTRAPTRWQTYDPTDPRTDDFLTGEVYTPLVLARGGVLPTALAPGDYLRFTFLGDARVRLDANATYAFMLGFDEPADARGLAFANLFFGTYSGGHALRRGGSTTDFERVFVRDVADPADVEAGREAATFPTDPAARWAREPGTIGYPDVDTRRDLVFYVEGSVQTTTGTEPGPSCRPT